MKTETIQGPTPNGGTHSRVIYLDKNQNPVEKKDAVQVIVLELDNNDKVIYRTYARVG